MTHPMLIRCSALVALIAATIGLSAQQATVASPIVIYSDDKTSVSTIQDPRSVIRLVVTPVELRVHA